MEEENTVIAIQHLQYATLVILLFFEDKHFFNANIKCSACLLSGHLYLNVLRDITGRLCLASSSSSVALNPLGIVHLLRRLTRSLVRLCDEPRFWLLVAGGGWREKR
jgi:hypothetical protein